MYELIQVAKNTFYMDCPSKVGFYRISESEVVLIDAGSDKDAGKKVKRILDTQGWSLKAIYSTHSHADHIGGNQYLQNQTGCQIYAPGIDSAITEYPVLEPTILFGGYAMKELRNKFLMAKESIAEKITKTALPPGLEIVELPGHSYSMVGFRTADNVVFLADCLSDEETLKKYQIGFLYDVNAYLNTLEKVKKIEADLFIPAHAPQTDDISKLAQLNIDKTYEIAEIIKNFLSIPMSFEVLLSEIFRYYNLTMNIQQRFLVGSTIKSYLSYLKDKGDITFSFENNYMIWRKI